MKDASFLPKMFGRDRINRPIEPIGTIPNIAYYNEEMFHPVTHPSNSLLSLRHLAHLLPAEVRTFRAIASDALR